MARRIRDDLGRELYLGSSPKRVVSLVPSETHNLFALGLGERLVGRTRSCVEPVGKVEGIAVVGDTDAPDIGAIAALEPDLILANKDENTRDVIDAVARERFHVFVSFPRRLAEAMAHLARLARLFEVESEPGVRDLIRRGYQLSQPQAPDREPVAAVVLIADEPLLTIGPHGFADHLLTLAGARNVLAERAREEALAADISRGEIFDAVVRSVPVTEDEVVAAQPELILVFEKLTDARRQVFLGPETSAAAARAVVSCVGKDLLWPGAWTIEALPRLRQLISSHRSPRN